MSIFDAVMATCAGLVFLSIGLYGVVRPYRVAVWRERLDAIGSTRSWDEIEPADWRITVARIMFSMISLVGVFFLLISLPEWQKVLL